MQDVKVRDSNRTLIRRVNSLLPGRLLGFSRATAGDVAHQAEFITQIARFPQAGAPLSWVRHVIEDHYLAGVGSLTRAGQTHQLWVSTATSSYTVDNITKRQINSGFGVDRSKDGATKRFRPKEQAQRFQPLQRGHAVAAERKTQDRCQNTSSGAWNLATCMRSLRRHALDLSKLLQFGCRWGGSSLIHPLRELAAGLAGGGGCPAEGPE